MATSRDGAAGEGRLGAHPLGPFCLLASLLALILSVGYALAPALTVPPAYLALPGPGGATPTVGGTRDASAAVRCAGPGCSGMAAGASVDPPAGSGSAVASPPGRTVIGTVVATMPAAPATAPGARATPAAPTPTVAAVRVTLDVAGGQLSVSVPVSLAGSPLLPELVGGYLRCWDGRARAYAASDTATLRDFLAEPARSEAARRIERLRAEGRVQRFEGGHAIAILGIDGDRAWLVDEYVVRVIATPEPRAGTAVPAPGSARAATPAPEVNERVRATFTLTRVDGGWQIADSVSTPVR
jgi:hypothetical protein